MVSVSGSTTTGMVTSLEEVGGGGAGTRVDVAVVGEQRRTTSSPLVWPNRIFSASAWSSASVISVRGSCSVVWVPSAVVVVVWVVVVEPTPITVDLRSSSSRVKSHRCVGAVEEDRHLGAGVDEAGDAGGVGQADRDRDHPLGDGEGRPASASTSAPNLSETICSPGRMRTVATLPLRASSRGLVVREQVVARHRLQRELAGGGGVVDASRRPRWARRPQHVDGVEALVGAGVGTADVQEDQRGARAARRRRPRRAGSFGGPSVPLECRDRPGGSGGSSVLRSRGLREGLDGTQEDCNEKPRESQAFQ